MRTLKFRELDQELQRVRLVNIELSGALGAAPHAAATLRRVEPRYEVPDHDADEMADGAQRLRRASCPLLQGATCCKRRSPSPTRCRHGPTSARERPAR